MSQTKDVTFTGTTVQQTADRAWEAEWFTDVKGGWDSDEGHRVVTLRAAHHDGVYAVIATISTAIEHETFKVRQYRFGKDPYITFKRERARFSQKRLRTMFDEALDKFDPKVFYVAYEVD
jgi:hypothetical protein